MFDPYQPHLRNLFWLFSHVEKLLSKLLCLSPFLSFRLMREVRFQWKKQLKKLIIYVILKKYTAFLQELTTRLPDIQHSKSRLGSQPVLDSRILTQKNVTSLNCQTREKPQKSEHVQKPELKGKVRFRQKSCPVICCYNIME